MRNMEEARGKVSLSGFELDEAEKAIVDNIIKSWQHKISERTEYDYIKIDLKKTKKGNNFLHEVKGTLKKRNELFTSQATDFNLFAATAEVLEKLLNNILTGFIILGFWNSQL